MGLQKDHLNFLRKTYQDHMVASSGALRQHIPALRFTNPDGGYFIWSYLPEETDAEILLAEAKKHQVGFQPGIKFSSAKGLCNYLRFCFAFYGEENLMEGVERLSLIIR